jgi:hypothetical protein
VFLINSRLRYFCCSPSPRGPGSPYCELTDTFLPSSLTRFHPFTLAHLRQSTCVGLQYGFRPFDSTGFSGKPIRSELPLARNKNPITLRTPRLRHPSKMDGRAGILTCCPSGRPFGFPLGPPNPWLIAIAKETLDLRCQGL